MKEQLNSLAQATGQDQSQLAEQALSEYVAFEAEQLARIHEGIRAADADEEVRAVFDKYRAYQGERAR